MINKGCAISVFTQCDLLSVQRSAVYYQKKCGVEDSEKANLISEIYRQYPMYGYRRIHSILRRNGDIINRKRVLRLMRQMNLKAIYPGKKTTVRDREHAVFPYVLKDLEITSAHQVWEVDITYLRTSSGFIYLTALIDVFSRYIVGWFLSNTMDTYGCKQALERALETHGCPEIINSDQGSQFTSQLWVDYLKKEDIKISMSGSGRSSDNAYIERLWRTLKYEHLFLEGARNVADYKRLIPKFISWYNNERPHLSLNYQTPAQVLKKSKRCGYEKPDFYCNIISVTENKITKNSLISH